MEGGSRKPLIAAIFLFYFYERLLRVKCTQGILWMLQGTWMWERCAVERSRGGVEEGKGGGGGGSGPRLSQLVDTCLLSQALALQSTPTRDISAKCAPGMAAFQHILAKFIRQCLFFRQLSVSVSDTLLLSVRCHCQWQIGCCWWSQALWNIRTYLTTCLHISSYFQEWTVL